MKIAFIYDVYPWIKGAEKYFEKYPTLAEWLNLLEIVGVENLERGKIYRIAVRGRILEIAHLDQHEK